MLLIITTLYSAEGLIVSRFQEYEEEGRRSRRHSSPCNSREGSTTALHTQHYDDAVSNYLIYLVNTLIEYLYSYLHIKLVYLLV